MHTIVSGRERGRPASLGLRRPIHIGISYMIPFVVVGGVTQALGLLIGGPSLPHDPHAVLDGTLLQAAGGWSQHTAAVLYTLGTLAFHLMAPVLAGYIAYTIAGRPGLMPGLTAGLAAGVVGAGYLGALIGGVLAGAATARLARIRWPDPVRSLSSFFVVPLAGTLISAGAMLAVIGPPIATAVDALAGWLTGLGGASLILLGAVLGAMIAADLGGPLNKVAYTFAVAGVTVAGTAGHRQLSVMAAVMAAGMAVPLGCWLATRVRPGLFTEDERTQGAAAGILGALFITEGAIPFAAARPVRVIPGLVAGGAAAGAGAMAFGATLAAPHGGVLALFAVGHLLGWIASLAVGASVAATGLLLARRRRRHVTRPAVADSVEAAETSPAEVDPAVDQRGEHAVSGGGSAGTRTP